jgi:hypothetical protein
LQDPKSLLLDELDAFVVASGFSLEEVRTTDDEGMILFRFNISGTTCVVKVYDYLDRPLPFIFAEFGVGIVERAEANQKIAKACANMYYCAYPLRLGVPPFENDCLLTLALRCEIGAFKPKYIVEVIEAAVDMASELRQILQIETIARAKAS